MGNKPRRFAKIWKKSKGLESNIVNQEKFTIAWIWQTIYFHYIEERGVVCLCTQTLMRKAYHDNVIYC